MQHINTNCYGFDCDGYIGLDYFG